MTSPAFVNAGAATNSSATAITPALPASRVNGNLLLAFIVNTNLAAITVSGAGWSMVTSDNAGSGSGPTVGIAKRYVDGSETAPTLNSSVAGNCQSWIAQYSGVDTNSAIGASARSFPGTTGTNLPSGLLTTTRQDSLAVLFGGINLNTSVTNSGGWSVDNNPADATLFTTGFEMSAPRAAPGNIGNFSISWNGATTIRGCVILELVSPALLIRTQSILVP